MTGLYILVINMYVEKIEALAHYHKELFYESENTKQA